MRVDKPLVRKLRLADIEKAPYNPRRISDVARKGLQESLQLFGMLDMPIINVHGGVLRLVGGHQRFDALVAGGYTHADCVMVDYDDATEKLANVALNNPAIQGTFDLKLSLPVLDSLQLPEADVAGFAELQQELRQKAERAGGRWEQHKALDEDRGETGEAIDSKEGVTYKLGKHRLFCGPCADGIPLMLGKKQAACCITDPPYNVAYSEEIENDDMTSEEWDPFVQMFCDLILKRTDGPCYVFMGSAELPILEEKWLACGGIVQRWLWWVKDRFTLGRSDYRHQHEPILYGWRKGLAPPPPRDARTNALQFPRPHSSPLHPCLLPQEEVLTSDGWRPISSVSVGDRVLSADGSYRAVDAVTSHAGPSDAIRIVAGGGSVVATGNHPFLVFRGSCVMWVESRKILVGDLLLSPVALLGCNATMKPWLEANQPDLLERAISEGLVADAYGWSMSLCGSQHTDQFLQVIKFITETETSPIIVCPTLSWSTPLHISGCTEVASCATAFGGSLARCAESSSQWIVHTGTSTRGMSPEEFASLAEYEKWWQRSAYATRIVESVESVEIDSEVWNLSVSGIPAFQTRVGMSHNTMKPVDLVRSLMRDATEVGDLVIEPFGGSGTTLVVAEELGRVCYATELSPGHCDTIRMRWATQTSGDGCDWRSLTPEA